MASEVPQGQIISLSPNNYRAFAYTNLFQHNLSLFAFASEHMVFIFDRFTFKETQVTSPDPSSQICALTFCGRGKDCALLMVNSKGVLYKFALNDVASGPLLTVNIGKVPMSMTANSEMCFIQYEHCLSAVPIGQGENHDEFVLTSTHSHDQCEVSPCGRALATFTRGGGAPVIWYAPFLKLKRSALHVIGDLVDFQWGVAEHLIAVSATSMGIVRLWVESVTSRELRCVKWFKFYDPVWSVSFAYQADVECVVESARPSKSKLGSVYPLVTRTRALILVTLDREDKNLCILQETAQPKMDCLTQITVSRENAVATVCDFRRVFSKESIRRLICITRFTKSSLSFHQCELGRDEVTHIGPFVIPFMPAPVIKIFKRTEVITKFANGVSYNWWLQRREKQKDIEMMSFQKGEVVVYPNNIVYQEESKVVAEFPIEEFCLTYAAIANVGYNQAMVVAGNNDKILVVFVNESLQFRTVDVKNVSDTQHKVSIHSSDMFVACSENSVEAYMFDKGAYHCFTSMQCKASTLCFLDHPMALLLLSFSDSLHFYIVTGSGFIPTEDIPIEPVPGVTSSKPFPPIHCMRRTDKESLLAASEHLFFRVILKKSLFPLPVPINSVFVLYTALSLSNFSVVSEFLRGPDVDPKCFDQVVPAESFRFPVETREDLPDLFRKICKKPPRNWGVLDTCGLNFVFSMKLGQKTPELWKFYPIFAIWALKSRDQHGICHSMNFKTAKQLLDCGISLWARDNSVLTKAITKLLTERVPKQNEVDLFLLLAILLNKIPSAKRIARVAQEDKLANFFQNFSTDAKMMTRIEKSAYEAQKQHRYALAAMFFILRGMNIQAVKVISDDRFLSLLVARLLDLDGWRNYVSEKFAQYVDNFYGIWWSGDTEKAVSVLSSYRPPKCSFLYVEMHKYELLRAFQADKPWDVLNLPLTPFFIRGYLNSHKEVVHELGSQEKETLVQPAVERIQPDPVSVFSFGMDNWENELDDSFSSDSESSESAGEAEPEKAICIPQPFESNLSLSFTASPYETGVPKIVTFGEKYIVTLLAAVFNGEFDLDVIKFLVTIVVTLYERKERADIVAAISYVLVVILNKPGLLFPLFSSPFDCSSLESLFEEFEHSGIHMPTGAPDVLSLFVKGKEVTENDIRLANFLTFNQICKVLEEINTQRFRKAGAKRTHGMSIIASFFHHRHRLLFRELRDYYFSDTSFIADMTSCGLNAEGLSDAMHETSEKRKWAIAIPNPFISTFYTGDQFKCSHCFEIKTNAESEIKGLCINSQNNHEIVYIEKEMHFVNISDYMTMKRSGSSQERLDSVPRDRSADEFDSPFVRSLPHNDAIPARKYEIFRKRTFKPRWQTDKVSGKDVSATCVDSHPTEPVFVTGESCGLLRLWNFDKSLVSTSAVRYCDQAVDSVLFNQCGDRILMTTETGYIFVSDFSTANLVVSVPGSKAAWLNTDTQIVVCEQRHTNLVVYDLLAGTAPVASFDLHKFSHAAPIAVSGSQVISGHDDGCVVAVDMRSGLVNTMKLHQSPVHALKYDISGRFFLSGAAENSIQIVNAMISADPEEATPIFTDYDASAEKRGVISFATSNQTIAACGHSSMIRVWHVAEPKGLFV